MHRLALDHVAGEGHVGRVGRVALHGHGEVDGFRGLLMMTDEATGTVQVIALWDDAETAQRHRAARARLRERVSATVDVELQETVGWDVPYTYLPGEAS